MKPNTINRPLGRRLFTFALASMCLAVGFRAHAREGVSGDSINLLQIADISGSRKALTNEMNAGALAYFKHVNSSGGVFGRKINLKTVDDGYVVDRTVLAAENLIKADDAFVVMTPVGTANTEKIMPLLSEARIPLIAPLTGATSLRDPFNRYVFHVRAGYAREVESMVEHVHTLGIRKVAVFYDDDPFGQDVLRSAREALARRNLTPVAIGKVERGSSDVAAASKAILAAKPQVVICGSFGKSLVEFVKETRRTSAPPQVYALSFFTAGAAISQLGADARGIAVTQVMPAPRGDALPLLREFQSIMSKHAPKEPMSYISLEGFVTAKVIVE
ncbi:MAG: ABC transporter substrate-binding protein, partial [Pseudomonadota bacterium]